jgi:hypothetical protein
VADRGVRGQAGADAAPRPNPRRRFYAFRHLQQQRADNGGRPRRPSPGLFVGGRCAAQCRRRQAPGAAQCGSGTTWRADPGAGPGLDAVLSPATRANPPPGRPRRRITEFAQAHASRNEPARFLSGASWLHELVIAAHRRGSRCARSGI